METIDIAESGDFLERLPEASGIYIFRDRARAILYIGKARSLKKRVSSYFQESRILEPRLLSMRRKIRYIDFQTTPTQSQALILEAGLIKQYKPRYNIAYRDDKSYPYVKIEKNTAFPRVCVAREVPTRHARYFGPYANAKLLRDALQALRAVFPFRSCARLPKKVCLYYHMRQCPGPCAGHCSRREYRGTLRHIMHFLSGGKEALLKDLYAQIHACVEKKDFESAALVRDKIKALESIYNDFTPGGFSALEMLRQSLGLARIPRIIECFDISCISGTAATGSMVQFIDGSSYKQGYRKFKIKTVKGMDDYAMMREVIARRYRRLRDEKMRLPDIIMIDGGKGHRNAAVGVLRGLGIHASSRVIAIAKRFEEVYVQGKEKPLRLGHDAPALQLLQKIRDEAHRFAKSYHAVLRNKSFEKSFLDDIKGVGGVLKQRILTRYSSADEVKNVSLEALLAIKGMNAALARRIRRAARG